MATENSDRDREPGEDAVDTLYVKRGCCFWIPCFGSDRSKSGGSVWWERIEAAEDEERWWSKGWKALMKVREWSEIIAGPRWKTFIRRFNKKGEGKHSKFQYDPLSYALNFDEGPRQNGHSDHDYAYVGFSTRYASIPISAKSSMDLGKDLPVST